MKQIQTVRTWLLQPLYIHWNFRLQSQSLMDDEEKQTDPVRNPSSALERLDTALYWVNLGLSPGSACC